MVTIPAGPLDANVVAETPITEGHVGEAIVNELLANEGMDEG